MRVIGLDIGSKTIGVAISDHLGLAAHGVSVIRRKGGQADLDALGKIVLELEVERIVYGLPLQSDGSEGDSARRARIFAEQASAFLGLPIEAQDESHSTVIATAALIQGGVSRKKRKGVVDQVAAVVILQNWLNDQDKG